MQGNLFVSGGWIAITPSEHYPLAGYAIRQTPILGLPDQLEANLLFLRSPRSEMLFLAIDALFVSDALVEWVKELMCAEIGYSPTVLIAPSHTHYAPALDPTKPKLGQMHPDYLAFVKVRLAELIQRVVRAHPERVAMEIHFGVCPESVVRRKWGWNLKSLACFSKQVLLRPNFEKQPDQGLYAIHLVGSGGKTKGLVWNYACHPTAFCEHALMSADFPGAVRSTLRQRYLDPSLPVLYFQGFSGDIRPNAVQARPATFRGRVGAKLNGPGFCPFSPEQFRSWSQRISDCVCATLDQPARWRVHDSQLDVRLHSISLDRLMSGHREKQEIRLLRVTLGDSLHLFAISAEVVNDYVQVLREMSCGTLIPVSCIGSVFGYLPTEAMLQEGGYEVDGFKPLFGLSGSFRPGFQQELAAEFRGILS